MSEERQARSEESLRHEYTEVLQLIRHYSNLRFAIYTILFAAVGGLGFVAFGKNQFDAHTATLARIAGIPAIALFGWYEERCAQAFDIGVRRAIELEGLLNYAQFTRRPARLPFVPNGRMVGRIFFVLFTLLWVYAVLAVPA